MSEINLRKMKDEDKESIIGLYSRFTEIDFMSWRNPEKMKESQLELLQDAVENLDMDSDIFVAEDKENNLLGFINITKTTDFFTGESQGYISFVAVSKEAEGKGVAKKLMYVAEEWTKEKGYKQLTLNVFAKNERAVRLYSALEYEAETMKMVKEVE